MKKAAKLVIWVFIVLVILCAGTGGVLWYVWSSNLPYIGSLKEYNPPTITEVFSDDGEVIGRFWDEKRIVIPSGGSATPATGPSSTPSTPSTGRGGRTWSTAGATGPSPWSAT